MSKRIFIERLGKISEPNDFDRVFWKDAGHEARFAAAAEMVLESELFRGKNVSESRLQRTVQHIKRRKS